MLIEGLLSIWPKRLVVFPKAHFVASLPFPIENISFIRFKIHFGSAPGNKKILLAWFSFEQSTLGEGRSLVVEKFCNLVVYRRVVLTFHS